MSTNDDWRLNRRGFLQAGVAASAALDRQLRMGHVHGIRYIDTAKG
jgi:hypothetical protein